MKINFLSALINVFLFVNLEFRMMLVPQKLQVNNDNANAIWGMFFRKIFIIVVPEINVAHITV